MKFDERISQILNESKDKYLYHIADTKNISKIKKKGILPLQPSNWIQAGTGKRYGGGEIYAFTNIEDALRWGAKMDWEINQKMGGGGISIIKFKNDGDWEVDTNDPLGQAANKGKWMKRDKMVDPKNIVKSAKIEKDMIKLLTNFGVTVKPKDVGL